MSNSQFLTAAVTIFTVVGLVHLLRIINGWQLVIGPWNAPVWFSGLAVLLTGYMAWSAWKLR